MSRTHRQAVSDRAVRLVLIGAACGVLVAVLLLALAIIAPHALLILGGD